MNSKAILGFIVVVSLIILGFFLFRGSSSDDESSQKSSTSASKATIAEGNPAPDFSLQTLDGQTVSLKVLEGKAVFVDFWAAWCPFCIEEMTEIEKIHQEFGDQLVVLGVHRSETEDINTGEKFAKDRGVTYPLLKDSDGSVYKSYTGGRNFMPAAAFINKEGKVIKLLYGPKTEEQMRQYVKQALGQEN